jgi:hypothetical protein
VIGFGAAKLGGREGIRTPGLLVANEALSQLSYSPTVNELNRAYREAYGCCKWADGTSLRKVPVAAPLIDDSKIVAETVDFAGAVGKTLAQQRATRFDGFPESLCGASTANACHDRSVDLVPDLLIELRADRLISQHSDHSLD